VTDPASASARRSDALALGALALLVLFAYANALRGAFVFDDLRQIARNPVIRDLGAFLATGHRELPSRAVAYLTFALNYRLGGLAVAGYHAVNVAIHLANAALLYALVRLTFATPRVRDSALAPLAPACAFLAAALFATHPLQTQAVTYVVQRMTSLATFFYLAAVVSYAAWRLGRGGRAVGYAAALVCALLAMKTKEIAFTLPFAVGLYEASFFEGPWRRRLAWLAPLLATAAIVPATLLRLGGSVSSALGDVADATRVQTEMGRLDYLRTQLVVVVKYLGLLFWPAGQNLDHDVPVYRSFLAPPVVLCALALAALIGLAIVLYRRTSPGAAKPLDPAARLAGFGLLWFFLALSVESSIIPIADVMYEHRAYLPSAGLFVAATIGAAAALRRLSSENPARATTLAAALVALVLASLTLARNAAWATDVAIWTDAAAKSPLKSRPHLNLGTALVEARRLREAEPELRRAVELEPKSAWARAQLGAVLLQLGRGAEGEAQLREAVRLDPSDVESLFNLGTFLVRTGRPDEGRPLLRQFVEIAPPAYDSARRAAAAWLRR
jgi:hypothetical protein